MNDSSRWLTHKRYLFLLSKVLFFGLFLGVGYYLFGRLGDILVPVLLSLLIAYLLDPLIDWFEERGVNRTLAIIFLMCVAIGSLVGLLLGITPTVVEEVNIVAKKVPNLARDVGKQYINVQAVLHERFDYDLPQTLTEVFQNYGQKIEELATQLLQRLTGFTTSLVGGTFVFLNWMLNALMVPLFTFYFLRDFDTIKQDALELVPLPYRASLSERAIRVDGVVGHWLRGQLTVAAIIGGSYAVALTLLDVKLGIPIAIIAGFVSVIPYVGNFIFLVMALTMSALDDGSGWGQFFGILAVFAFVQVMEGYVITPKIVGEKVGLSPVMVIIVLLIGAELFGFLGILLAIPAAAVIRVFMLEAISEYKRSRLFLGEEQYLKLLVDGARGADADVREALRQSAEARLDIRLPSPMTTQELNRMVPGYKKEAAAPPSEASEEAPPSEDP